MVKLKRKALPWSAERLSKTVTAASRTNIILGIILVQLKQDEKLKNSQTNKPLKYSYPLGGSYARLKAPVLLSK